MAEWALQGQQDLATPTVPGTAALPTPAWSALLAVAFKLESQCVGVQNHPQSLTRHPLCWACCGEWRGDQSYKMGKTAMSGFYFFEKYV